MRFHTPSAISGRGTIAPELPQSGLPREGKMADQLCARCGSKVMPLPQREARLGPGSELIALVAGGAVYRVLMAIIIAALTALGFVYWAAWIVAALLLLALSYIAYTKWKASHRRFFCDVCGIDLPSDMVRKT